MPNTPKLMTAPDLCARYGLARPNLSALVRKGLPVAERVQRGGGSKTMMIDEDVFLSWVMEHGRDDGVARIMGDMSARLLATQKPVAVIEGGGTGEGGPAVPDTWEQATGKIGVLFVLQWGTLLQVKKRQAATTDTSELGDLIKIERGLAKQLLDTYEILRRGSKDSAEIALSRGEVRPVAEVRELWVRIAATVRERVLAIPSRLVEQVVDAVAGKRALTGEKRQAALVAVNKLLAEECHVALASLAEGEAH